MVGNNSLLLAKRKDLARRSMTHAYAMHHRLLVEIIEHIPEISPSA
jgi:hypothetical protein